MTKYDIVKVDLTKARTTPTVVYDQPGVEIRVLKADDECYIILDNPGNKEIGPLYQNLPIKLEFRRIFVKNPAGSGQLILLIYKE